MVETILRLAAWLVSSRPKLFTIGSSVLRFPSNSMTPARTNNTFQTLPNGSHELDGISYIYHDGIAYVFPGEQSIRLENDVHTGSRRDISTQYSGEKVSHEVFTLGIDHGARPNNNTYSYIVAPEVSMESVIKYTQSPPVKIVHNTPQLQAVSHRDLDVISAAFYKPGELSVDDMVFKAYFRRLII